MTHPTVEKSVETLTPAPDFSETDGHSLGKSRPGDFQRCQSIGQALASGGLFKDFRSPDWRISPKPFPLPAQTVAFFESLGTALLQFYQALNTLYLESLKGRQPSWVHEYLDLGKPSTLLELGQMKRFRDRLPDVIRPDIIPTDNGLAITELDSVPGGIGTTALLSQAYGALSESVIGGTNGMIESFANMIRIRMNDHPGCLAIVVSDEANEYRPEMTWLASHLQDFGIDAYCIHPRDVLFTEEALFVKTDTGHHRIALIYRFYELFDLKNIPKSELVMYSVKKGRVEVTPPYKPWMEEKLAFALLHHPRLESFWRKVLERDTFDRLLGLFPNTWILDPRPIPPSAVIPGLILEDSAVADWQQLAHATQRQRRYVVKPSGFSELAWGGRGVVVGHDVSQSEWAEALNHGLASFETTPHILQDFHKGSQYVMSYADINRQQIVAMSGRVRLSPYYFVTGTEAPLGGILATLCPNDKKIIHGMRDAILAPCSVQS